MPRPRLRRWVSALPRATYFKPQGLPLRDLTELCLPIEGLEALRLADLEGLTAEAAAAIMGVSRHTFGRVLAEARAVVARALVCGAALRIGGGHYGLADPTPETDSGTQAEQEAPGRPGRDNNHGPGAPKEDGTMRQGTMSFQGRGGGGRCGRGQGQGQGMGQGRGMGGQCGRGGQGGRAGQAGRGSAAGGGGRAAQPGTDVCVCPRCGQTAPHTPGSPCTAMTCPACGAAMTRE